MGSKVHSRGVRGLRGASFHSSIFKIFATLPRGTHDLWLGDVENMSSALINLQNHSARSLMPLLVMSQPKN